MKKLSLLAAVSLFAAIVSVQAGDDKAATTKPVANDSKEKPAAISTAAAATTSATLSASTDSKSSMDCCGDSGCSVFSAKRVLISPKMAAFAAK